MSTQARGTTGVGGGGSGMNSSSSSSLNMSSETNLDDKVDFLMTKVSRAVVLVAGWAKKGQLNICLMPYK